MNGEQKILVQIKDLVQHFTLGRFTGGGKVHALNGVSLSVHEGETLGLVGETGCGKTTLCRTLLRLYRPTSGQILFEGQEISRWPESRLKPLRRHMQMVFQDPAESMNSRLTVGAVIEEPLTIQTQMTSEQRRARIGELLEDVGLPRSSVDRYPHEFSGGQRQRIAVARALPLGPRLLVCDEPVSALDVSIQAQILNLLLDLQERHRLTMVFVSHALNVVRHMSDRVVVMYLGSIMEWATSRKIYEEPQHPYTQALIAANPGSKTGALEAGARIRGEVPSPLKLPSGCPFHQNCPRKVPRCVEEKPTLREIAPDHWAACHLV